MSNNRGNLVTLHLSHLVRERTDKAFPEKLHVSHHLADVLLATAMLATLLVSHHLVADILLATTTARFEDSGLLSFSSSTIVLAFQTSPEPLHVPDQEVLLVAAGQLDHRVVNRYSCTQLPPLLGEAQDLLELQKYVKGEMSKRTLTTSSRFHSMATTRAV